MTYLKDITGELSMMGKNNDPILIFKSKNATKLGEKGGLVTKKVKDNPTV